MLSIVEPPYSTRFINGTPQSLKKWLEPLGLVPGSGVVVLDWVDNFNVNALGASALATMRCLG